MSRSDWTDGSVASPSSKLQYGDTLMQKSLAVILLAALAVMVCTSAMADTWQISVVNDTGVPVDDIELTLGGTGGGITGPILAVNPPPFIVTFTAPPPGNELDANWVLPLNPGQPFVADFNLTTGLTPSLIGGTWTVGGGPVGPVNPLVTTFADIAVTPEPSTMVLAGLAAAGLAASSLRRRRNCNMEQR
jgi:hypothetical protein